MGSIPHQRMSSDLKTQFEWKNSVRCQTRATFRLKTYVNMSTPIMKIVGDHHGPRPYQRPVGVYRTLLPKLKTRPDGRGRPWRDSREVLNGILWILRTGAQWSEMPGRYPPYQTCHRRFQQWRQSGVMDRLLEALAQDLEERGKIDLDRVFH